MSTAIENKMNNTLKSGLKSTLSTAPAKPRQNFPADLVILTISGQILRESPVQPFQQPPGFPTVEDLLDHIADIFQYNWDFPAVPEQTDLACNAARSVHRSDENFLADVNVESHFPSFPLPFSFVCNPCCRTSQ